MQREQSEVGADPKPFGLGRDALQQGELRKEVEPRGDVVLAGPDRVEAQRANKPDLLQRLGEAPGRIVARGVLGIEIDAELHGSDPLPTAVFNTRVLDQPC